MAMLTRRRRWTVAAAVLAAAALAPALALHAAFRHDLTQASEGERQSGVPEGAAQSAPI